jgi:hypothetical protein
MANRTYGELSGTSMAAAHVAGAAALLVSHFPECTNNQIRNAMIRSSAKPPSTENFSEWDQRYGWGIVNVGKAYELLAKGCVYAGGVHYNGTETGIPSNQARGGRDQIAIGASTQSPTMQPSSPPTNAPTKSPNARSRTCALLDWCGATLDTWTNMSGTSIADFTSITNNFTTPSNNSSRLTDLLESLSNIGNNYGIRIRGWLYPPVTGDYMFWIASDDSGELWLSTNSDPMNKNLACHQKESAPSREWDKYPEQMSKPIPLVAGQFYYYEVRECAMFTTLSALQIGLHTNDSFR